MLQSRFKQMCKDADLDGNFTNHSGRSTAITRMYEARVPEKAIMKRSGHRSIEGVRAYHRENVLSSSSNVVGGFTSTNSTSATSSVNCSEND